MIAEPGLTAISPFTMVVPSLVMVVPAKTVMPDIQRPGNGNGAGGRGGTIGIPVQRQNAIVLAFVVTEPFKAQSLPDALTPEVADIEVVAMMFPMNSLPPSVAEEPTAQYTVEPSQGAYLLLTARTFEPVMVTSLPFTFKIN